MYATTTLAKEFLWTVPGKERVAIAIRATLQYNRELRIHPRSLRKLAEYVGYPNHTSIGDYANARTDNPNRDNCRVLRDLAPYIYRINRLEVRGTGVDRFVRVHHEVPEKKIARYWEVPGLTYADNWADLVMLGTSAGDSLEHRLDKDSDIAPTFLVEQIKRMRSDAVPLAAKLLNIPASTLVALRGGESLLNKSEFNDLGQVIRDFLVRITEQKTEQWDLVRLANALKPDAPYLTEQRLQELIDGAAPEERDAANLASLFQRYGVEWDTMELYARGFAHQPQQRSLPLEEEDHENCEDGEHCHSRH